MKKLFLLTLLCVCSVMSYAQFQKANGISKPGKGMDMQTVNAVKPVSHATQATASLPLEKKTMSLDAGILSRRSAADGVFYDRPAGTYWCGWTRSWGGWYTQILFCLPIGGNEFVNACTDPAAAVWSLETESGSYPLTGDEETNNYTWTGMSYNPASDTYDNGFNMFYVPTISVGEAQYTMGEDNEDYGAVLSAAGRISPFAKSNISAAYSGWSGGGFIYGTGADIDFDFDDDGVTEHYLMEGLWELHEKPVSPMYVESIVVLGRTNDEESGVLIDDATPLKILVTDVYTDENNRKWPGDNVLAELTCKQADVEPIYNSAGDAVGFNFVFANKQTDAFGSEVIEPFVLSDEYCIILSWTGENNKVNIAANEFDRADADKYARTPGYMILKDEQGETSFTTLSYNAVTLTPIFQAMFDYVKVYDELTSASTGEVFTDMNVLTALADGGDMWDVEDEGINTFAYVETFLSWTDAEGNDNYFVDDLPEWINDVLVYEDREGDEASGFTFVSFNCQPLPAGVSSRTAEVHITGRGFTSDPIIIIQNSATGIHIQNADKKAVSAASYNVAGQRVNKNYKGLVINNGRKIMNK